MGRRFTQMVFRILKISVYFRPDKSIFEVRLGFIDSQKM